jgi:hypothetical protein
VRVLEGARASPGAPCRVRTRVRAPRLACARACIPYMHPSCTPPHPSRPSGAPRRLRHLPAKRRRRQATVLGQWARADRLETARAAGRNGSGSRGRGWVPGARWRLRRRPRRPLRLWRHSAPPKAGGAPLQLVMRLCLLRLRRLPPSLPAMRAAAVPDTATVPNASAPQGDLSGLPHPGS